MFQGHDPGQSGCQTPSTLELQPPLAWHAGPLHLASGRDDRAWEGSSDEDRRPPRSTDVAAPSSRLGNRVACEPSGGSRCGKPPRATTSGTMLLQPLAGAFAGLSAHAEVQVPRMGQSWALMLNLWSVDVGRLAHGPPQSDLVMLRLAVYALILPRNAWVFVFFFFPSSRWRLCEDISTRHRDHMPTVGKGHLLP